MQKIKEHTFGNHIYVKLQLDNGQVIEVDRFAGSDYKWNDWKTTVDHDPVLREKAIAAFKKLY